MLLAYQQRLDPLEGYVFWSSVWSTFLAALPVLTLFYLLVPRRWLASKAAAGGAVVAILVAWLVFGMPFHMAGIAFLYGAAFGVLPVGLTIFGAMLLYNVSVVSGDFRIVRRSVAELSGDARIQAVLIGFAFGAFLEGAAGGGSPVAICGAIMVGLGFNPFKAAVICLIANTSPVAYGGLGTPIIVLKGVTGLDVFTLSQMAGRQLPILSCLIPFWMVRCMCGWRQTFAVWPVLLVAGGSFALFQFTFAHSATLFPMTDIGGGIFSLLVTAAFLRFVWKPKEEWHFDKQPSVADQSETKANGEATAPPREMPLPASAKNDDSDPPLTAWRVAVAWMPFALMSVLLLLSGLLRQKEAQWISDFERDGKPIPSFAGLQTVYLVEVPGLHNQSWRAPELQKTKEMDPAMAVSAIASMASSQGQGVVDAAILIDVKCQPKPEAAVYRFEYLTSPATPVCVAAVLSMLLLRMNRRQCGRALLITIRQMKIPIPTIALMIGLSYVTRYAGLDGTLGYFFSRTGRAYPFFAAILGWLGVFLTGTDAGSNALFGSLQKIVADRIYQYTALTQGQAQVLICTSNSTGGVMGKMIDAQSICVATAATNQIGREANIFKAVIWHSIALASIVGLLALLQAYVYPFTLMVPHLPGK
jgi:lactate permease